MNIWRIVKDIKKASLEIFHTQYWDYLVVFLENTSRNGGFDALLFLSKIKILVIMLPLKVSYLIQTGLNTLQNVIKLTGFYNSKAELPI